jgi:hypothetical protein
MDVLVDLVVLQLDMVEVEVEVDQVVLQVEVDQAGLCLLEP